MNDIDETKDLHRDKWKHLKKKNKARYTATKVACGWAGAIFEVTKPFGQEQRGQSNKIIKKSKV